MIKSQLNSRCDELYQKVLHGGMFLSDVYVLKKIAQVWGVFLEK